MIPKNHTWKLALLAAFIALAIIPASASLKDSGTFEAWVSADSLTNGTVWSICRIKDSSYMRIFRLYVEINHAPKERHFPCRNSHMHSVDEGVVLQMSFDNDSSYGEQYGGGELSNPAGETGLVGNAKVEDFCIYENSYGIPIYWRFNNAPSVGENYNGTNASLVYDYRRQNAGENERKRVDSGRGNNGTKNYGTNDKG